MGWTSLVNPISALLNKVVPDADKRAEIAFQLDTMAEQNAQAAMMAQIEVNKQEAAHKSLFVAGWRPAVGWVCTLGLLYNVLLSPFLDIWFTVPPVNTALLETTLYCILGLGAIRAAEKIKNVAREK